MFPNQQAGASRATPLGASGRLQNGKAGMEPRNNRSPFDTRASMLSDGLPGGSQWTFTGPMGGAPGLSTGQSRANGTGLSSFAQTIGSSQPHTPLNPEYVSHRNMEDQQSVNRPHGGSDEDGVQLKLNIYDDREFPSLSATPQVQQNTTAQQMWANPSLRTAQQPTIQRPQGQPAQGHPGQSQHQQLQTQAHEDGTGGGQPQYSGSDEYRYGGQSGVGQLSGSTQPQTGNMDDFPPLGGVDVGPDRRTGMIQNAAAYGTNVAPNPFPGLGQTRNGLSSPTGQQDRINSSVGDRTLHAGGGKWICVALKSNPAILTYTAGRAPFENIRGNAANARDIDRNVS
jgi:CCR4-NOT transcription complex subunit 2